MAIEKIDAELCNGCGICVISCTADVIRMDEQTGQAVIRYAEDCQVCEFCAVDCPQEAITVTPDKVAQWPRSWG